MQAQAANTPVDPAIVTADNTFGLKLFQNLNSGATGNVAIAPISVAMALQIVYNGAAGVTQQGMAQTLQLGSLSTPDLNNDNAALQGSLMNPDPQVQLTIANSLWMHLAVDSVPAAFTQMDQTYYGATVGDLAGAPANVNNWVSTETNGLITNILPNIDYRGVIAVIANVIYFKGQWTTAFDPSQTTPAPFTLADGTQVSVQMMHQSATYGYQGRQLSGGAHSLWPGPVEHAGGAAGCRHQLGQFRRRHYHRHGEWLGGSAADRHGQFGAAAFLHELWRIAGAAAHGVGDARRLLFQSAGKFSRHRAGLHRRRRAQDRR
jgi:hypothetical protein